MASHVKHVANSTVQVAEESDSDEEEPTIEVVEDGSKGAGSLKPRKRRRLKCYLVFHGDRASRRLPHCVRVKCPRDGSWDNGPCAAPRPSARSVGRSVGRSSRRVRA